MESKLLLPKAVVDEMKRLGLKRLFFALDPAYIPHVDPCNYLPQDHLHMFGDGIVRSEGAWLFYVFFNMGLSRKKVNAAIKKHPFADDVRVPKLHESLREGKAGGRPKSSKTLRMTGTQCTHFALARCLLTTC